MHHTARLETYAMKIFLLLALSCVIIVCLSCRKETPTSPPESKGSISFIAPIDSAIVLESTTIDIQVTSDQPVAFVELTIDGSIADKRIFEAPPYLMEWQTDTLLEGSIHELDAKAYLKDGSSLSAPARHVTVYHFTPSNLLAQMVCDTLVTLTWKDNSSKETSFDLQESINGSTFVSLQRLPTNTITASVPGKYSIGDSLVFRIRALKDTLASNFSNTARVSIVFPAPSNLLLLSLTDTQVQLSWQDNAAFGTGFVIEHSTTGVTFATLAVVGRNASPATVSDTFGIDSTHYFRVKARSTINTSGASNIVSTTLHRLKTPGGLSITSISNDSLMLQWTDNVDYRMGFAIERQVSGGQWTEVQRVGATVSSWMDASVEVGTSYAYRIRAFTSLNYSSYSVAISARFTFNNNPVLTIKPTDPLGYKYVTALVIPPDSKSIICAVGRTISQYDIATGSLMRNFGSFQTDMMGALAISRDGSVISARGCNDSTVFVWRVADGSQVLAYRDYSQTVYSVDLTSDGSSYAIPGGISQVVIRSTKDGKLLQTITPPTNTNCVAFNNTGDILAVEDMNTALLYRVSNGSLLKTLPGHSEGILSMAFNPSGTMLATGSLDKTLKLWDINGALLKSFTPGDYYVDGVSFDPTGNYVAAGGLNSSVMVWKVSDGSVARALTGYSTDVKSTRFSPDGKFFVTGEYSGKIRIYRAYGEWVGS